MPSRFTERPEIFEEYGYSKESHKTRKENGGIFKFTRKKWFLGLLTLVICVCILTIIVMATKKHANDIPPKKFISEVIGAVVSDNEVCSDIGRDMLKRQGSAVDAAIATLLCIGLHSPHSMGIGGGFFGVVSTTNMSKVECFDARESAPSGLTSDVYKRGRGEGYIGKYLGGTKIGVPGEIKGYWEMHKTYGKLSWEELFTPTINLARSGYYVSHSLARALQVLQRFGINPASINGFCELYCNKSGYVLEEGDVAYNGKLATTLEGIANYGPSYLYDSDQGITNTLVEELKAAGGKWKLSDFKNYQVRRSDSYYVDLGNTTLHTLSAPSGGPVLGLILNILRGVDLSAIHMQDDPGMVYHMIVEAMKLAYGVRHNLADPDFVPQVIKVVQRMRTLLYADNLRSKMDHHKTHNISYYSDNAKAFEEFGTAHVSVLGPEGDAVSVTSTVNTYFGSLVISNSTGIIWNNEMTDFSTDSQTGPSINGVQPGKRPLSSMTPAIFSDKSGKPRLILGAAGGSMITNTVAQIAARVLFLEQPIDVAIRSKRLHHKLVPNTLTYEFGFPMDIIEELQTKYGHRTTKKKTYLAVAEGILRDPKTGEITAFADERKVPGKASLLKKSVGFI